MNRQKITLAVLAVLVSPLTPIGVARAAEPDPGPAVDAAILVPGLGVLVAAVLFLAAIPANLLFPLAVFAIVHMDLNPEIWLSPLVILGAQWYILFNVIAGASAIPQDLLEIARSLQVKRWLRWRTVLLPGVAPYAVTGAITAWGGAWNATIVAEAVHWGEQSIVTHGLGAYIAVNTEAGDFERIALGVAVMCAFVVAFNRLLWRPLYDATERRFRLQ